MLIGRISVGATEVDMRPVGITYRTASRVVARRARPALTDPRYPSGASNSPGSANAVPPLVVPAAAIASR